MPRQERGLRRSRPLTYAPHVDASVDTAAGTLTLTFASGPRPGAAFHVTSGNRTDGPWTYTTEAGRTLQDTWNSAYSAGSYDLTVHGPNGFVRVFKGSNSTAGCEVTARHRGDDIELTFTHTPPARPGCGSPTATAAGPRPSRSARARPCDGPSTSPEAAAGTTSPSPPTPTRPSCAGSRDTSRTDSPASATRRSSPRSRGEAPRTVRPGHPRRSGRGPSPETRLPRPVMRTADTSTHCPLLVRKAGVHTSASDRAGQKRAETASQTAEDRFQPMERPPDTEWSQDGYARRSGTASELSELWTATLTCADVDPPRHPSEMDDDAAKGRRALSRPLLPSAEVAREDRRRSLDPVTEFLAGRYGRWARGRNWPTGEADARRRRR